MSLATNQFMSETDLRFRIVCGIFVIWHYQTVLQNVCWSSEASCNIVIVSKHSQCICRKQITPGNNTPAVHIFLLKSVAFLAVTSSGALFSVSTAYVTDLVFPKISHNINTKNWTGTVLLVFINLAGLSSTCFPDNKITIYPTTQATSRNIDLLRPNRTQKWDVSLFGNSVMVVKCISYIRHFASMLISLRGLWRFSAPNLSPRCVSLCTVINLIHINTAIMLS